MRSSAPTEPAFRRVGRDLRRQIVDKTFRADAALPTEAEVAAKYSVSRQTVRRAFQDLVTEGLVFRVPGRGTFVTPDRGRYLRHFGSIEDLMALSADSELRILQPLSAAIDPVAASRLRLPDDRLFVVSFARLYDETAFCHTRVYLPPSVRACLKDTGALSQAGAVSRVTVIGLLDEVLPTRIQDAEQSITVELAPADVAQTLDVAEHAPLLRIDRTYYDTDAAPVELAVSHFVPERYSYRIRLRRSVP